MTFSKNRKHRRRSGAGHKKQARPSWLKWGLLATTASVAVTSAIFAAGAIVGGERADADFCYDRPDQDTAALFLDNSLNYLTAPQLRDYRAGFEQAYNRARANTRLFIFTTASDIGAVAGDFAVRRVSRQITEPHGHYRRRPEQRDSTVLLC